MKSILVASGLACVLGGCTGGQAPTAADLRGLIDIASAAEAAYAAAPGADPAVTSKWSGLVAAAQAALLTAQASPAGIDITAAEAAVAALTAYEATAAARH